MNKLFLNNFNKYILLIFISTLIILTTILPVYALEATVLYNNPELPKSEFSNDVKIQYINTTYVNITNNYYNATVNTTQMTDAGGVITILESWLYSLFYGKGDTYNKTEVYNKTEIDSAGYFNNITDTLNDSFGFHNGSTIYLNMTAFDNRYVSGGYKSFYFTNHTSDVAGTYNTTRYLSELHDLNSITVSSGDGDTLIAQFISPLEPAYIVAAGQRKFSIEAKVSSTAKRIQLRGLIYIVNSTGGQPILLRNSTLSMPLMLSVAEYYMTSVGDVRYINETSRILFQIYAVKEAGGPNIDTTIYLEDDTFSRLDVPSPVGVTDISGLVPYNNAVKNVDLGPYNITAKWFFGLFDFTIDTSSASWLQFNGSTLTFNYSNILAVSLFKQGTVGNTKGAIINQIDNHTQNSNNIIFAIVGNGTSNVMMPHFWIQNGGPGQASGVSRSFMIVNENPTQQNTTNITSCIEYSRYANFSLYIDCNTTTTGADLLVGDDMQVVGDAFFNNTNVTGLMTTQNIHVEGNVSIKRPYGMFSSTEVQVVPVANTPYVVTFNWTEDSYLIYKQGNENFSVSQSGDYKIDLSAIFTVDLPNKHAEIWVQKTNSSGQFVNIPRSNTRITITSASTESVVAVPFILDLLPTEKYRIVMASDDAGTSLVFVQNTSYSPMVPSIIMTIHKVSEIPTG